MNIRILQTMVSGIHLMLGLGTPPDSEILVFMWFFGSLEKTNPCNQRSDRSPKDLGSVYLCANRSKSTRQGQTENSNKLDLGYRMMHAGCLAFPLFWGLRTVVNNCLASTVSGERRAPGFVSKLQLKSWHRRHFGLRSRHGARIA